jgi:hypothetical protein
MLEFTETGLQPLSQEDLFYTHPLNDNVTWWLSPNNTFTVTAGAGGKAYLTLLPGWSIDHYQQRVHILTAFAMDSVGNVAAGQLTLNIVECNRAPGWFNTNSTIFNVSLRE